MAAPDAEEMKLIGQFRVRLADLMDTLTDEQKTDIFLARWLRARENDLDQSEAMLRASLKWREENGIDTIGEWVPPPIFRELCPAEFLGYDDRNCPVTYFPFGKWNLRKVVQIGEKEAFVKFIDQMFESSLQKMKDKLTPEGLPVTQAVYISDAGELSMRTLASVGAVDMILQCVKRFEANHPETLRGMYIVNAGAVFATLFALMKPLLSQRTFGKMQIFNSSSSPKCQEVLHSHIPLHVLPVRYSGANATFKDIYLNGDSDGLKEGETEPDFISITVPAGDKVILLFSADKANSTINYSFKTDKYDVAFAIHTDSKQYVENCRVNSHEKAHEGTLTCETAGDYIFTFDNTYSRLRTKSLEYKIDVMTPEGTKQAAFA